MVPSITIITTAILGLLFIVLGSINMTENLSSLHWYHYRRVTEENRKPFGRLMGLGSILCGVAIILFGAFLFLYESTQLDLYSIIGTALLILGIGAGLIIIIRATTKYNRGLF